MFSKPIWLNAPSLLLLNAVCSLVSFEIRDHLTTKLHKVIVVDRLTKLSLMAQHIPCTSKFLILPKNIGSPCLSCLLSSWKAQIVRNREDREERELMCIHEECLIKICGTKHLLMARGHFTFISASLHYQGRNTVAQLKAYAPSNL